MAATLLPDVWNTSVANESLAGTDEPTLESYLLYRVQVYLWNVVPPAILLLGNFGNVMTIIIMQRIKLGESVFNICFTALAVVDLISLDVGLLAEWLGRAFESRLQDMNGTVCKIYIWITTQITTTSAWILVCLTITRAISVVWPHRVNVMCTYRRAVVLLIVIAALSACFYSHNLYGFTLVYFPDQNKYFCSVTRVDAVYGGFLNMFFFFRLVIYSLLPFLCIIVSNGVMVWKLRTSARETGHKFAKGQSDVSEAREKAARSVTKTTILVSMAFIVLTCPPSLYYILSFLSAHTGVMSTYHYAEYLLIGSSIFMMQFSNNAVNFYLYCLTGKRFREEFIKIIHCGGLWRK